MNTNDTPFPISESSPKSATPWRVVALWRWVSCLRPKPKRKAVIVMYDGALKIVSVSESQSGFVCKWGCGNDTFVRLLAAGNVEVGTGMVRAWRPHSGWTGNETFFTS